jgi:hypothetical protein
VGERLEWWMHHVLAKSGAEVTAVQTLREFRRGKHESLIHSLHMPNELDIFD